LKTQIGNPEGADIPNKKLRPKKMDPWKRNDFQRKMSKHFADLNNVNI
jgi:fructose-bisphosphate aldolase class II